MSGIDPWFLMELKNIIDFEKEIQKEGFLSNKEMFLEAKKKWVFLIKEYLQYYLFRKIK
jgi:hypothetical protein